MSLADALTTTAPSNTGPTRIKQLEADMPPEEWATLHNALLNPQIASTHLERAMKTAGYTLSAETIRKWRRENNVTG